MGRKNEAHRTRGKLGIDKAIVPQVQARSWLMYNMMHADLGTYGGATPALPDFLVLIQNLDLAEKGVRTGAGVKAAARDVERDLLVWGMQRQLAFVQMLADASPGRAVLLIQNAGLLVAAPPVYDKPLLGLHLGSQPGTVIGDANVGLLVHQGGHRPRGQHFLSWQYTLDNGQSFLSAGDTPGSRLVLPGLPLLSTVGVRVCLSDSTGTGAWSHVIVIATT